MSGELVLARPERRRILRELLASEGRWTAAQRVLYADVLRAEYLDVAATVVDDCVLAGVQKKVFADRLLAGEDAATAMEHSRRVELPPRKSRGQEIRERKRAIRKAVTALDAREVVTLGGPVAACLVCGEPLPRIRREDRVYCPGGACKQRAARLRAKAAMR